MVLLKDYISILLRSRKSFSIPIYAPFQAYGSRAIEKKLSAIVVWYYQRIYCNGKRNFEKERAQCNIIVKARPKQINQFFLLILETSLTWRFDEMNISDSVQIDLMAAKIEFVTFRYGIGSRDLEAKRELLLALYSLNDFDCKTQRCIREYSSERAQRVLLGRVKLTFGKCKMIHFYD